MADRSHYVRVGFERLINYSTADQWPSDINYAQ